MQTLLKQVKKRKKHSEYEVEDINFVLMTTQNPRKDFFDEMITKAVTDTTCTKTCRRITAPKLYEKP